MPRTNTDIGTTATVTTSSAPSRRFEVRMLLVIAGPLIAAYLADFAMTLTTKAIVGRLGYRELAGIGLAGDLATEVLIILVGILSVVGVLVAQAEGAGHKEGAGTAARQGFIVATVIGVPAAILVWHLDVVLALTGQDPDVIALMGPYLHPLAFGLLPLLWFFVLRIFVASLAKTGAVLVISLVAVGLNYVMCLGLVTGSFGLPELGVAGAGWAKSVVSVFMLLALLIYIYMTPNFRGYGLFRGRINIDLGVCKEIVRLGLPVGGLVALEAALFAAVSIFSGILGAVQLATYNVIIAWVGIAFMTSHGLAEAGMVRVAHTAGRGSIAASRQAGLLTFAMGVAWLTLLSIIPLNFPEPLVRAFLDPADPGFDAVLILTTRLLILVAFFQVFDGLQVMASLALRGLKDTIVPLWLGGIGYWVFGIAGGWVLAFPMGMDVTGLWWGMAVGLVVTGSLLALRFWMLTRR
jgi:MATE family multidrug resistance protein